ncbi:MAG TPA: hypothetical protein VER76_00580 [Pyrinomonadaceae bacterium]|nr:hypothetical protein [Pyrinomonadaceae bacterium]
MRQTALIFGMLLTLAAGVWTCAPSADAAPCAHDTDAHASATASDEHDCCLARIGQPDAHHPASPEISHEATHQQSTHEQSTLQTQTAASHAGTHCDSARDSARDTHGEEAAAAGGDCGRSCFECCAGRSGQTPTTAVVAAPEQGKAKRDAAHATPAARQLFAHASPDISHLAPSQHAPPQNEQRRHILISVFLI